MRRLRRDGYSAAGYARAPSAPDATSRRRARSVVLATRDQAEVREQVSAWSRRLARASDAEVVHAPPLAPRSALRDLARATPDLRWLVCGLRWPHHPGTAPAFDEDLAVLVRSVRCPVLTVQPWVEPPGSPPRVAVVGVDRSAASRRAAHAAAELLIDSSHERRTRAELVLAHGYASHPAELARRTRWKTLTDDMRIERQPWIADLAESLSGPDLAVDVVVETSWTPDLVAGLVQRAEADVAALGVQIAPDDEPARLDYVHRRVLRGTPCPLVTATGPSVARPRSHRGESPAPPRRSTGPGWMPF